jgi:hypothetical protein
MIFGPASSLILRGFQDLDGILDRASKCSAGDLPGGAYSSEALRRRLLQCCADLLLKPHLEKGARRWDRGLEPFPDDPGVCRYRGFFIDAKTGLIKPGFGRSLYALVHFFIRWCGAAAFYFSALVRADADKDESPAALVLGAGIGDVAGDGGKSFLEFCDAGTVAPLKSAARIVAEFPGADLRRGRCVFTPRPLWRLCANGKNNGLSEFFVFLADHTEGFIEFLRLVRHNRLCVLLADDFIFHAAGRALDRRRILESVVLTNSLYHRQLLWMTDGERRSFQTHLVWYSTNNVPLVHRTDKIKPCYPPFKYMRADLGWMWSEDQAASMRELGASFEIRAAGPILWTIVPERGARRKRRSSEATIGVFDVTPWTSEMMKREGFPYSYYNADTMIAFHKGIFAAAQEVWGGSGKFDLLLKSKRGHHAGHDRRYIDFLRDWTSDCPLVKAVDPAANIFELIGGCDVVIVSPYSSPAYVASLLGVPAVFFDPESLLRPEFEPAAGLKFAAGKAELTKILAEIRRPVG